MSDWVEWHGGECPVAPGTIVEPVYRGPADDENGVRIEWPCPAGRLDWSYDGIADDIVAYRIVEQPQCLN